MKTVKTYKDMEVTREDVVSCGADWQEQLEKTGRAGHKRTVTEVTVVHDNFLEALLPADPLFKEARDATGRIEKEICANCRYYGDEVSGCCGVGNDKPEPCAPEDSCSQFTRRRGKECK